MGGARAAGGQEQLTILLTTHYLEEADRLARRIAIVSRGEGRVEGTPEALKRELLGDAVTVELEDGRIDGRGADRRPSSARSRRPCRTGGTCAPASSTAAGPSRAILSALEAEGITVASVTVARPSLDDVYLHFTGRDFRAEDEAGLEP